LNAHRTRRSEKIGGNDRPIAVSTLRFVGDGYIFIQVPIRLKFMKFVSVQNINVRAASSLHLDIAFQVLFLTTGNDPDKSCLPEGPRLTGERR